MTKKDMDEVILKFILQICGEEFNELPDDEKLKVINATIPIVFSHRSTKQDQFLMELKK